MRRNVSKVMIVIFLVSVFGLAGCGGGGDSGGGSSTALPASDFTGTWSGTYSGTAFLYTVTQSGNSLNMIRTTPISTGITYSGTGSGDTAKINTYGNGNYMGYTTWTKTSSTSMSVYLNECIPITGFSCGGSNGITLNLTKKTVTARFTKIDNSGNQLPATATNWSCVKDTDSGLLWEVKTDDGGLRDKDWVYTAYETTGTNGDGVCDSTKSCNETYFKNAVNLVGLCGYKDWRLPNVTELESLQDSSQSQAPYINTQYFPFTVSSKYWATNIYTSVWWVDFSTIYSASTTFKDIQNHVRLVKP